MKWDLKIRKEEDGTYTLHENGGIIWENQIKTKKEAKTKANEYLQEKEARDYAFELLEMAVEKIEINQHLSNEEAFQILKEAAEDL